MKKSKNVVQLIITIVCIVGFLACVVWLIYYFVGNHQAQQQVEDIKNEYVDVEVIPIATEEPVATSEPVVTEEPTAEPVEEQSEYLSIDGLEVPQRTIDFAGLQANENAHIYAWIYIPNTNVDYPILQHPDDPNYYLEHDTKGNKVTAGSIFTQYYNSKDFNDNNTVIYGHNMKNGTMFKTLHYFEDNTFFDENPYVYIYTETGVRVYQIFAAYEYGDMHLLLNYNMSDKESFGQYLEGLTTLNGLKDNFNWDIGVTSEDKIITLSTCIGNKPNNRYLVQAKLIAVDEAETPVIEE